MGMRLIDADDLAAKIMIDAPDFMDGGSSITKAFILAMVKTRSATPTVDAVPVVRCKDCKKWHTNCLPSCGRHGCDVFGDYTKPDDFCSFAERREGR